LAVAAAGFGTWRMVAVVQAGDFAAVAVADLSSMSLWMQVMIRLPIRIEDRQHLGCWNIGSPIETMWMMPCFSIFLSLRR